MPYFKKLPIIIEAHQWQKPGDHPHDNCKVGDNGEYWEGEVVRYFRSPDPKKAGRHHCEHCEDTFHHHGWIDTLEGGHIVCPGDWIITGLANEMYPCKPDIFARSYQQVPAPENTIDPNQLQLSVEEPTKQPTKE